MSLDRKLRYRKTSPLLQTGYLAVPELHTLDMIPYTARTPTRNDDQYMFQAGHMELRGFRLRQLSLPLGDLTNDRLV